MYTISGRYIFDMYTGLIPKPQPKNTELDDVNEIEPYYCWNYINCFADAVEHKQIENCMDSLDNEDLQLALEKIPEARNVTTAYPNIYSAIEKLYCIQDDEFRSKIYYDISQQSILISTVGCEKRYSKKVCDHFFEALDCALSLFAKLSEEKKCVKH
ncbi:hypothetical protein HNY73_000739 [Argiope bruennichi]|uniref:Uncharacterized protein n=1 Tax=Argiope bruennichi TaxID=94029 RepID=A0A8T0G0A4_ARGBR|nr:hypothetical protein HNY73_000739 [Argiope bruennichi]